MIEPMRLASGVMKRDCLVPICGMRKMPAADLCSLDLRFAAVDPVLSYHQA